MSTYSLSDGLASGAPRVSRAPLLAWVRESGVGILASFAWIAFGLSCLLWEDVGDWSRTHSLGIAAFIV
ncbi:MAG TPA: ABC transporter permease, partial [Bradyrhizobium sp.]